jgi:hypothetical protein
VSANARTTRATTPGPSAGLAALPTSAKAALALAGAVTALGIAACSGAEGAPPARIGSAASPRVARSLPSGPAASLPLTEAVRRQLADAYFSSQRYAFPNESRDRVIGPKDVSYGVIWGVDSLPSTYYAVGSTGFTDNQLSRQGGPHVWRKEDDASWTYLGDTGLAPCTKVPRDLYVLWGFEAKYGSYSQCER